MNQAPSDNERRNPDDRQYHPGQRPELPTALAQTLVGGMTDQRLQNPRREPLSGELFLNFYLDDVRLELARATLARHLGPTTTAPLAGRSRGRSATRRG